MLATTQSGNCLRQHQAQLQQAASLHGKTTQLWLLFQDLYGMIWAQRLIERARDFERSEKWQCSLTLDGFTTLATPAETEQAIARALPAFRWLLGRFFAGEWVDAQLNVSGRNVLPQPSESTASSLARPETDSDDSTGETLIQ
ncbi:MAG: hypothetical protein ACKPHU_00575 [Planctomycetaceae bacterium]